MKIKVASLCMDSGSNSEKNISDAISLIEQSISKGANWIILPEMFSYMGAYKNLLVNALTEDHVDIKKFCNLAKKHSVTLFLGTIPEKAQHTSKVYNTLLVIDKNGNIVSKYRKTHLFNLNGATKETSYRESDGYLEGDSFETLNIDGFQVHLTICYDIRFSKLLHKLQESAPCDVIICPSAFAESTGKRHWHLLMKSRAIEFQSYVIASAQTGTKKNGKSNYGHALICDPMGKEIADSGSSPGIAIAEISKSSINSTRKTLPVLENHRVDLY